MEQEITIDANGLVTFERAAGHGIPERHERTIDDSEVSSLLWKLHAADFFSMPRRFDGELCETLIDDSGPTAHLTVEVEDLSREVVWYGGCGGPSVREISRLVRAVEEAAGIDEWSEAYW